MRMKLPYIKPQSSTYLLRPEQSFLIVSNVQSSGLEDMSRDDSYEYSGDLWY